MTVLGKPKNKWGWLRIVGSVGLIGVAIWTLFAVVLRSVGGIAWMQWSGYQSFLMQNGFEVAMIPLGVVLVAGILEDQTKKMEAEQIRRQTIEQTAIVHRNQILQQFREAILSERSEEPVQKHTQIANIVHATLPQLDEKGKGEALLFLYETKLVTGEQPLDLKGSDFTGTILAEAMLEGICLEHADLSKAKLRKSCLEKSHCAGVNLNRAVLQEADLRGAILVGSNLRHANLVGANLENADLRDAHLKGTHLMNANLTNCVLTSSGQDASNIINLLEPAVLIDTILPDGRMFTNEKGKEYLQKKEYAEVINRL